MCNTYMEELRFIQQALKAPKGQYNYFGKYKYRSCEDILEAVKPLLKETNCMLTISDDIFCIGEPIVKYKTCKTTDKNGRDLEEERFDSINGRVYIKATATLTNKDGKSVSVCGFAREEETKKGMDSSQITGAASSYARKYALNGLFCIDDNKDSDSTNTHGKEDSTKTSKDADTQSKSDIDAIIKRIYSVTSREQLANIFKGIPSELKDNTAISEAFNQQGKKFPRQ